MYKTAAEHGKRVQAQGGAKNYMVVMPDANLDITIPSLVNSFYGCAGQRCLAGGAILAVGSVYESLLEKFTAAASKLNTGYGLDEAVDMGPVISNAAKGRVLAYIEKGLAENAKLVLDGRNICVQGYEKGAFVGPTVFTDVTTKMTIGREEIFGPVVSFMRVKDLDEALDLIHKNPFGNSASIYSTNGKTVRDFNYKVQCGNIGVNLGVPAPMAFFPFSGYKDSFFGDLHGQAQDGIYFFTDRKVIISRW
ncbi:MAG: aldehyde dehydrogenase family protein [Firmicutes bacterium]|nr:aldehyde dehydrogenase family protein [Bacillota bacterium]